MNWFLAIPFGSIALFSFILGLRRSARFFYHVYQNNQAGRLMDFLIAIVDVFAMVVSIVASLAPRETWVYIIPITFGMCLVATPLAALLDYWRASTSRKMYKRITSRYGGAQAGYESFGDLFGRVEARLDWYEFVPIGFAIGWLVFFAVSASLLAVAWVSGSSQGLSELSINISFGAGMFIGAAIILFAYTKLRRPKDDSI